MRENKKTNIVIGGETTTKGHYPWQAAIYYADEFLCGGSLIDSKHIVTAAHCFKYLSMDLSLYRVVLGDHNRDSDEGKKGFFFSPKIKDKKTKLKTTTLPLKTRSSFFENERELFLLELHNEKVKHIVFVYINNIFSSLSMNRY